MSSHHLDYTWAAVLSGMGIYAYVKTKSVPSLVGSLGLAAAFYGAGYLVERKYEVKQGNTVGLIAGAAMTSIGIQRYVKTKKPVPGLIIAALGGIATGYHGWKLNKIRSA